MSAAPEARVQREQAPPPQEVGAARRLHDGEGAHRAQARRPLPVHSARRQPVLATHTHTHTHRSPRVVLARLLPPHQPRTVMATDQCCSKLFNQGWPLRKGIREYGSGVRFNKHYFKIDVKTTTNMHRTINGLNNFNYHQYNMFKQNLYEL